MPISHKIRQYRALFGVCALRRNSLSTELGAREVIPSREYGGALYTKILIGSPRGLGIGLLEQSCDPSLVVPLQLQLSVGYPHPSWYSDIFDRIRGGLRLRGRYPPPTLTAASCAPSTEDLAHNPSMSPDWESNWWLLSLWDNAQSAEPHQSRPKYPC